MQTVIRVYLCHLPLQYITPLPRGCKEKKAKTGMEEIMGRRKGEKEKKRRRRNGMDRRRGGRTREGTVNRGKEGKNVKVKEAYNSLCYGSLHAIWYHHTELPATRQRQHLPPLLRPLLRLVLHLSRMRGGKVEAWGVLRFHAWR